MRSLASVALLAACATPPPTTQPVGMVIPATTWLAKFEPGLRFVPASTTSITFVDRRAIADPASGTIATHVEIRCEPDLRIEDHGSYGIPPDRVATRGESRGSLLDVPVWATASPETWAAFVDDRFVVRATSRPRLAEALRREATLGLTEFAGLTPLDPATTELALRSGREDASLARWVILRSRVEATGTVEAAK